MRLRSHVLIIAAATLLPMIAIVCLVIVLLFQRERDEEMDNFVGTARALSLALDRSLEITVGTLNALATSEHLQAEKLDVFYKEANRVLWITEGAEAIALITPKGSQILNTRVPAGTSLPRSGNTGLARRVAETQRPAVSNLFVGSVAKKLLVVVGVPVISGAKVKYVLTMALSPMFLQKLVEQQRIAKDSVATIVDGNGTVVARNRDIYQFFGKPTPAAMLAKGSELIEGWQQAAEPGDQPTYLVHRRSEFSGWMVIITVPKVVIDAPLWRAIRLVVGAVLGFLLLALGLAAVFGRRITSSIASLAAGAKALGSGESVPITPSPVFEIDEVRRELEAASAKRNEMETNLRQSEARLRAIIDAEPECVKVVARDGKLLDMNAAGLRMLEAESLEGIGNKTLLDFVLSEHRDAFSGLHQKVMSGGSGRLEFEIAGLKGRRRWLETYAVPLRAASGEVTALLGATRDITERRRAEEQLRYELQLIKGITDSAGECIFVTDGNGKLTFASPEALKTFGFSSDELLGRSLHKILHHSYPDGRPFPQEECVLSQTRTGGVTLRNHEDTFFHKDGSQITVECSNAPVEIDGRRVGAVLILRDITDRKRTQEALRHAHDELERRVHERTAELSLSNTMLRESEELLRAILNNSPTPVFIKDPAGKYLHVNSRFSDAFGLQPQSVDGKTDAQLFSAEQAKTFMANDRKVLETGHALEFEEVALYRDGVHTNILNEFPLRDREGNIYALCGIATDITERKHAEEARRELTVELDRRVAERTRELQDSQARLRALVAELTRAEEGERRRLAVELHDYLAQTLLVCRLQIDRAAGIAGHGEVKELLAETQKYLNDSINYTRTLMAELSPRVLYDFGLPPALRWLATRMGGHGLSVEIDGSDELSLAEEQAVFLFQCIRELLWNVVKHAATDQAKVSYNLEQEVLTVRVTDHGKGFDPASLNTNDNELSQFGLFSVQSRVEMQGGSFKVHSSPGQGTCVTVTLPQVFPGSERPQTTSPKTQPTAHEAGKPIRIVLVDDHQMMRQGLRSALEGHPEIAIVGEAADGLAAVAAAQRFGPDVVLMDINLPEMDGIEATQRILDGRPSTIVIGLSFDTDEFVVRRLKAAGAVGCVPKERAVEDVYRAIVEAVQERRPRCN